MQNATRATPAARAGSLLGPRIKKPRVSIGWNIVGPELILLFYRICLSRCSQRNGPEWVLA